MRSSKRFGSASQADHSPIKDTDKCMCFRFSMYVKLLKAHRVFFSDVSLCFFKDLINQIYVNCGCCVSAMSIKKNPSLFLNSFFLPLITRLPKVIFVQKMFQYCADSALLLVHEIISLKFLKVKIDLN